MDHDKWDHTTYLRFLIEYRQAKELGKESFKFDGGTHLTGFVHRLIETLDKKFNYKG